MATAPTTGDTAETADEPEAALDHDETGDVAGRDTGKARGDSDKPSRDTEGDTEADTEADTEGDTEGDTEAEGEGDSDEAAGRTLLGIPLGWGLGRTRARPLNLRPRRPIRLIDVLRVLGLARRAVPRPVVGPKACAPWWQRVLALAALAALVAAISFALAAFVGFMVVVAGFLLERAIS